MVDTIFHLVRFKNRLGCLGHRGHTIVAAIFGPYDENNRRRHAGTETCPACFSMADGGQLQKVCDATSKSASLQRQVLLLLLLLLLLQLHDEVLNHESLPPRT